MRLKRILLAIPAVAAVGLTLLNASWLAPAPPQPLVMIAQRGTMQMAAEAAPSDCPARNIRPIIHTYVENTLFAMQGAVAYGAGGFALDIQSSGDGHAVVFRDASLECRTNGRGRVSEQPLASLKQLDVGHGYSPDGGRTFPLRGRGIGAMPTAVEVIQAFPRKQFVFRLADPAAADALVRAYREAGRPIGDHDHFAGSPEALARLRQLTAAGKVVDPAASARCLSDYRRTGWVGQVPGSCRDQVVIVPRGGSWTLWGWPYRFFERMRGAGATLLIGGDGAEQNLAGLDQPEQLGEVPQDYGGLLLIEDMFDVGRSLRR